MQIIQIIQYAQMMVLYKGTLEDSFLILLETTAHFYQDTKRSPHSISSHRYKGQSAVADKDGDSHREIPGTPLFPVTEPVGNLGQVTYSLHRLAIPL